MRRLSALIVILTALAASMAAPASNAQTSEELVKATFLYRFASFVTWPPEVTADPASPIRLCTVDADVFSHDIERAVANQRVDGHPFEVRRIASLADAAQCQVLYAVGARTDDALRAVRGRPVLTVTDGSVSSGARGIVHFVVVEDRVRFHIDDARASESGLAMSSRLLALAVSVRRRAQT